MYIVMTRYGSNFFDIFSNHQALFSTKSVYSLGLTLLNILEKIHKAGYVYNDLKLDNLMLDYGVNIKEMTAGSDDPFEKITINIIDFGFATPYVEADGQTHIQKQRLGTYRGNIIFSSLNQLKFYSTSRRDDLISLFYLLIYMLKGGEMPGTNLKEDYDPEKEFSLTLK